MLAAQLLFFVSHCKEAHENLFTLQNGIGIVLAGGLAGFVAIQNQRKNALQEDLGQKITDEQKAVKDLKTKVHSSSDILWFVCA